MSTPETGLPDARDAQELIEVIREAMKPRLIRTVPPGEHNEGAQEWAQPGAEEIAVAVAAWLCPICRSAAVVSPSPTEEGPAAASSSTGPVD